MRVPCTETYFLQEREKERENNKCMYFRVLQKAMRIKKCRTFCTIMFVQRAASEGIALGILTLIQDGRFRSFGLRGPEDPLVLHCRRNVRSSKISCSSLKDTRITFFVL